MGLTEKSSDGSLTLGRQREQIRQLIIHMYSRGGELRHGRPFCGGNAMSIRSFKYGRDAAAERPPSVEWLEILN
jgi:hypothetical protein